MNNDEQWISTTEMDRRNKADQQSWQATKHYITTIDWDKDEVARKWLYKLHDEALDNNADEDAAQARQVLRLMNSFRQLAIQCFGVTNEQAHYRPVTLDEM